MTQEFHLSVTPVGGNHYLVRTEHVEPGVPLAEEQLIWAVDDWLTQTRQLMNDPLVGLLQGSDLQRLSHAQPNAPASQPASTLLDLGYQLYGALFQGTLRDSWLAAQSIAQHRQEMLRLRLGLKGARLPRLPWEVMCGSDRDGMGGSIRPLATGIDVVFSRYQPSLGLTTAPQPWQEAQPLGEPLRILMVIASPSDRERLSLTQEARALQAELQSGAKNGTDAGFAPLPDIELKILEQPGRERLTQALEQGQYHVLHYAGHSDLSRDGGDLYLVNERTGLTESLSGDDLAGLLVNNGIRMAVFNSCRGAYTAHVQPVNEFEERNLSEALVNRGIPAVLAMADRIPDDVALTLTHLFYRNLKQGYPLDLSLSRARQGLMSAYGSHQLYWALPTLYMHCKFDGYLIPGDRAVSNPADRLIRQVYDVIDPQSGQFERLSQLANQASFQADNLLQEGQDGQSIESIGVSDFDSDLVYDDPVANLIDLVHQLSEGEAEEKSVAQDPEPPAIAPHPSPTPAPGESTPALPPKADHRSKPSRSRRRISGWGIASGIAIAFVSIWGYAQLFPEAPVVSIEPSDTDRPSVPPLTDVDLPQADTTTVTAIAISRFNQEDWATGQEAVEILLNRGAITEAQASLNAVPADQTTTPTLHFLRGRLIWQSIRNGDFSYPLPEARRQWEAAVQSDPHSVDSLNALGFAYYAEEMPDQAIATWIRAIEQVEAEHRADHTLPGNEPLPSPLSSESLTAYAGIALAFQDLANHAPTGEQAALQNKASKIYHMVMDQAEAEFNPAALQSNWLWDPVAIEQWRLLERLSTPDP